MKKLSERLRAARKQAGISQLALAKLIGATQASIAMIETGKRESSTSIAQIATILGVDANWLATGKGEMKPLQYSHYRVEDAADDLAITIPIFEVEFSMGAGAEQMSNEVIRSISITPEWINSNLPNITSHKNLRIGSGRGDSMLGTFNHGDMLVIDSGVVGVPYDGIYAFSLNKELFVKRLQRRPDGSFSMISDNKQYEAFVITQSDDFHVFGRVVWAWNGKKL